MLFRTSEMFNSDKKKNITVDKQSTYMPDNTKQDFLFPI